MTLIVTSCRRLVYKFKYMSVEQASKLTGETKKINRSIRI